jgi:uncharacterized phiE125 gp8 family phage protein
LYLDWFPECIELRKPPVQSVSSIAYLDENGDSQTLSSSLYRTDLNSRPSRIEPAYGQSWPSTYGVSNSITVTFLAGYTTQALIPEQAKQAIKLLVSHWYSHRDAVLAGTIATELPLGYGSLIRSIQWAGL